MKYYQINFKVGPNKCIFPNMSYKKINKIHVSNKTFNIPCVVLYINTRETLVLLCIRDIDASVRPHIYTQLGRDMRYWFWICILSGYLRIHLKFNLKKMNSTLSVCVYSNFSNLLMHQLNQIPFNVRVLCLKISSNVNQSVTNFKITSTFSLIPCLRNLQFIDTAW